MSNQSDLASLTAELASLRQQVEAQAAELAELKAEPAPEERRVTRRHLLTGLAGLGAAGVAGIATAAPAAADDGDPLVLGEENTATSETLISTTTQQGVTSDVQIGGPLFALAALAPSTAIHGEIPAGGLAAVWGRATGAPGFGVHGSADVPGGFGVVARSKAGPAILALSEVDGVTVQLEPADRTGPPSSMADGLAQYRIGSLSFDEVGDLWVCVTEGAPGVWTRLLREDTAHGRVIPITPIRALDTRAPGGRASGSPTIPGQRGGIVSGTTAITLDLAGVDPIPPTASGVIGNATVISPTASGLLRVIPAGATYPSSSFDFTAGRNVSGGFTSGLGAGGLRTTAPVPPSTSYHLVIDIAAYIT